MESKIFENRLEIGEKIKKLINEAQDININKLIVKNTRAIAEIVKAFVFKQSKLIFDGYYKYLEKDNKIKNKLIKITEQNDIICQLKVLTHKVDTDFNMPNVISIDKLVKTYKKERCIMFLIVIHYYIDEENGNKINVSQAQLSPIEYISLDNISIGNLGKGQIQIKKLSNTQALFYLFDLNLKQVRKDWLKNLHTKAIAFYNDLLVKTSENIKNAENEIKSLDYKYYKY